MGRTGPKGTADQPLPANVRMYDIAGGAHATVAKAPSCKLAPGRLDWVLVSRATLLRLDQWVAANTEPPPTRLMPLQPANNDPTVLRAPKNLPDAVIQVPKRDADGNPLTRVTHCCPVHWKRTSLKCLAYNGFSLNFGGVDLNSSRPHLGLFQRKIRRSASIGAPFASAPVQIRAVRPT